MRKQLPENSDGWNTPDPLKTPSLSLFSGRTTRTNCYSRDIHSREDEAFFVLEGELQFHVEGRGFMATSGAWVTLARGSVHFFKNTGAEPARMLIVVTPAGLEDFFLEIGREAVEEEAEPVAPTPEDIQKLIQTAPKYGLEIRMPHS